MSLIIFSLVATNSTMMEVDSRLTHPSIATRILVYQRRRQTLFEIVLALRVSNAMRITHNNCDLVGISRSSKVRMRHEAN